MKISVTPARRPHPTPRRQARHEQLWAAALPKPCPECHAPAGLKCTSQWAPYAAADVAYELRKPHRARQ